MSLSNTHAGYDGKMEISIRKIVDPWPDPNYVPRIDPKTRLPILRQMRDQPANLRSDLLMWMQVRGLLEQHQYLAGCKFRALLERESIGAARAVDPTREPVDGDPPRGEPLVRTMEAAERLMVAQVERGPRAYAWLRRMLSCDPGDAIRGYEVANWRGRKRINALLRRRLDRLARLWKLAG